MAGSPSKAMRFPVYQIDFSAVASGKRVAATKRRIRWRFGFPNVQALDAGRTAQDARGEEHEVVVIWSITSGKRQILMDGKEITYSSSRAGVLDHSWATRGNHVIKVVCHAAAPMTPTPGFRQYDLLIDGQSFFSFPKVYELGVKGMAASPRAMAGGYSAANGGGGGGGYGYEPEAPPIRGPRTPDEEEAELQKAINASLAESRSHLNEKVESAPVETADLLDMGGNSGPGPSESLVSYGTGPPQSQQPPYGYGAPPPQTQQPYGQAPPQGYGQPPAYGQQPSQSYPALMPPDAQGHAQPSYGASPYQPEYNQQSNGYSYGQQQQQQQHQPVANYGAPPQADYGYSQGAEDPFAPKPPSFHETANEILKGYGSGPSDGSYNYQPGVLNSTALPADNEYGQPYGAEASASYDQQSPTAMNGMAGLSMEALTVTDEEPQNPFDAALKKLVNIDRIDEPAEVEYKLTMKKQEEQKKGKHGKSVPKPPAAQGLVGSGATLSQISSVKPETKVKEDIMRAPPQPWHPDAVHAGALVVHGQGPPPLGQPQGMVGFGAGYNPMAAQMYGGGGGQAYYGGAPPPPQGMPNGYPPQPQAMPHQGYGYR